jgi:hypothetical protein
MTAWKRTALLAAALVLTLGGVRPAFAQVDRVAMRTHGLSCGDCAAVSEVYLRQLPGIGQIKISMSQELIVLTLKPNSLFDPYVIRDALDRTEVDVLQFQVSARGSVQGAAGKQVFVAGKNKFVLVPSPVRVPSDAPVTIEGIVNDRPDPMELKALNVTPLAK